MSPFLIGRTEVSNEQFALFVEATGHTSEAERFGTSFAVEQFVSEDTKKVAAACVLEMSGQFFFVTLGNTSQKSD